MFDPAALAAGAVVAVLTFAAAFVVAFTLAATATYLNDPRRPKPPLGWPPWERPGVRRRADYAARYGWYKARAGLCSALVALGAKKSW